MFKSCKKLLFLRPGGYVAIKGVPNKLPTSEGNFNPVSRKPDPCSGWAERTPNQKRRFPLQRREAEGGVGGVPKFAGAARVSSKDSPMRKTKKGGEQKNGGP